MSEQIGKHKGAVETLLHEKKELSRLIQIVNSQLQRHLNALEEAGIDTDEFIEDIQQGEQGRGNQKQSDGNRQNPQKQDSEEKKEEADPNELLENDGEDDFGSRDFNPNS
ncbi:MAG: hypothetical protein BRC27_01965 [Nanohaloarchaea archaeon SW_10_44_10]|nr:MAG: hypothetical protein BRC27_01965 [Nanohaloarchaea archaeon SW_10_44_10]